MKPSINDLKRASIIKEMHALAVANSEVLDPMAVVERARDPRSAMHDEFQWDDGAAAEAYRLAQAGALIRRVAFTFVRADPVTREVKLKPTRAYQSRQTMRKAGAAGGGYEGISRILSSAEKRSELVATALRELQALRRRYESLVELSSVWAAVDAAAAPKARARRRPGDRPAAN